MSEHDVSVQRKGWFGRLLGRGDSKVSSSELDQSVEADQASVQPSQPTDTEAPAVPADDPVSPVPSGKGWLQRLRDGLSRSSERLSSGIGDLFLRRRLDDQALEDLQDLLITSDIGVATATRLTEVLARERFGKDVTSEEVRSVLAGEMIRILEPVAVSLVPDSACRPFVILVAGVNGAGKTTTIGKLARQFRDQGLSVTLAAGDTFRAAAVEQLKVWGERTGCPVVARDSGADAAGLVFDALQEARARQDDVLLVDTAGRLHNKVGLMEELAKIRRVLSRIDSQAPHSTLLVLDATVGQNAHQQVEAFRRMVDVSGLVLTKLDGTAKGGVVVSLAATYGLPVHYIGVGETAEDLRPFSATDFARSLMGLPDHG
ncbi:signal recognition particle-docking protein FtsY [Haematospirillum sp. 15-248]|uniref:signal recognition particle-docking protein FtsY n=1 Tax=Haematospirillum sp. 15-248 TaxID=2723107 RepID=UPI00143C59C4|nr:signal recognition particle-docking protein FtsY [Haematospirillum sp. 15-248]NKD88275.1 signal recognition particle-docking protein FtsY [Haematospirillum sp. 15-248]